MSKSTKDKGQAAAGKSEPPSEQDEAIRAALAALTPRWRAFIQEYCTNGFNAAAAARAAGFSARTANRQGSRLLTNVDIARARDLLLAATRMSPAELISRISDDATATMLPFIKVTEIVDRHGVMHHVPSIDLSSPDALASLRHVRRFEIRPSKYGDTIAIQLVDDQRAKDQLAKIHGLYIDKQEVSVSGVVAPEAYTPDNGRGPKGDA